MAAMTALQPTLPKPPPTRPRKRSWFEIVMVVFMAWLVIVPLAMILWGSFRHGAPYEESPLSLDNYVKLFTSPAYRRAMLNTVIVGISATAICLVGGTALAWITTRVALPGIKLIKIAAALPFFISSFVGSIAWVYLGAPRVGVINQLLSVVWPGGPQVDIYTLGGIVWVQALYDMPVAFLMMSGTMASLDASIEESARVTGAGPFRVFRSVTLPLLTPSLVSCGLLCFIHSIENYAVPQILGTPVGVNVLATRIAIDIHSAPPSYGTASASAMLLMVVSVLGMVLYYRATRRQERFVTVTGKGVAQPTVRRGWPVYVGVTVAWLYVVLAVVLPIAMIIVSSFQKYWGQPIWDLSLSATNYVAVIEQPKFMPAVRNTLFLATVGPTIAVAIGFSVSYLNLRRPSFLAKVADAIAIIPHAIPGMVIGLALLWTYLFWPIGIYGTVWIMLLALVTRFLPYANRPIQASLMQLSPELEEASRVAGARKSTTFRRVLVPLTTPALLSAWMMLYVVFIREISTVILLFTLGTYSMPIMVFERFSDGWYNQGSALAVMQLGLMLVGWLVVSRFIRPIKGGRRDGN
jgi:iron(III) transport system permease protein